MPEDPSAIIFGIWGMYGPLRDDDGACGDYPELLFLKMSDEYAGLPYKRDNGILYKPGVKAAVVFFDKRPCRRSTEEEWLIFPKQAL